MISRQKFPKDFLWGASTASHQVEGGTVNQWSVWELAHASDLAAGAEKRLHKLPDWKDIKPQAESPENYVSGQAVDHYNRYEEDFDILEKLQFNSLRFGVEWSRIEPKEGAFDLEAIKHYHDYIDSLNNRGITPILNVWHWTMPTWFTDKGGFERKENIALFEAYVQKVTEEYGDKVKYFITLNEPSVYTSISYISGEWPPQQKSIKVALKVYRNLAKAHNRAYAIMKAVNPALQIGIAAHLTNIQPRRPHNLLDVVSTKLMSYGWNWWFVNRVRRHQDFVGINHYRTEYYQNFGSQHTPQVPVNDLGWYMEPEGIYPLITRAWAKYKKPIIITENGVADRNDAYRQWWIEQTVIAMQRALSDGVDLKGYMHWSLLDNFEWADGWWPKFGLVAVDRDNDMKRTPRPSALWFAHYMVELRGRERERSKKPVAKQPSSQAAIMQPKPTPDKRPSQRPASTTTPQNPTPQPSAPAPAARRIDLRRIRKIQ